MGKVNGFPAQAHADVQQVLVDEVVNLGASLGIFGAYYFFSGPPEANAVRFALALAAVAAAAAYLCRKPAAIVLRGDGLWGDGADGGDGLSDDDAAAPSDDEDLDDLVAVLTDTWDFRAAPDNDDDDDDE